MKKILSTEKAPSAIGPYSQGVKTNGLIFVSGQLPIDRETGKFAGDSIKDQTKQSLVNAKAILESAGYDFDDVVKTTVYLDDIKDFAEMNGVYAEFFTKDCPARAAFEVAKLPLGAKVEIEMIASK